MLFPHGPLTAGIGGAALMPVLPIRLTHGTADVDVTGLADSGAMVNVLPYDTGLQLGLDWNAIQPTIPLAGNLGRHSAKGVVLLGTVASYPAVRLTFAWSQSPDARLILGQINFFMEFDVCFFRSRGAFDVRPKP
jgi:hypothetical protein